MKQFFFLLLLLILSVVENGMYAQQWRYDRAYNLYRQKLTEDAVAAIDSVIVHPETKNSALSWTTRAYLYFDLYKKTDKQKLYSALRDTIISSLKKSYALIPDTDTTDILQNNRRMTIVLATHYWNIARVFLQDSLNFDKSLIAYNKYKELVWFPDTTTTPNAQDGEYFNARASVVIQYYSEKWKKNKNVDTNEYIFVKRQIDYLEEQAKRLKEEVEKDPFADKNILDRKPKPMDRKMTLIMYNNFNVGLYSEYNYVQKLKYQNESSERQALLDLSNANNQIARLELEKRNNDIAQQKKGIELLEKEKELQKALAEKKELEAKEEKKAMNEYAQKLGVILLFAILGVLVLFVIVFLVYRSLTTNKKQKKIILEQKIEVENQRHLLQEKNKEITDSINYAQKIQHTLMASDAYLNAHLRKNGRDYFILYQPKDIVSGDYYWAYENEDEPDNFILLTADCTGHGVPGAFMSLLCISYLNEIVKEQKITSPDLIFNQVRDKIVANFKVNENPERKDGMDAVLCKFNFAKNELYYSAGNNPVVIIEPQDNGSYTLLELDYDKMPVGVTHDGEYKSFTNFKYPLKKGSTVYTFTDGFADQFGGPKGKKFMYKQLRQLLFDISKLPMQEQKEKLHAAINAWMINVEQVDDVCVIGVRV